MYGVGMVRKFGAITGLRGLLSLVILTALAGCAHGTGPSDWQNAFAQADAHFGIAEYEKAISGFQQAREMARGGEEVRSSLYAEAVSRIWGEDFPGARDLLADLSLRSREAGDEVSLSEALALYAFVLQHLGEEEAANVLERQRAELTGDLNPFIWRYDEDSELTRHLATGMSFPSQISSFYQASISQNNEYGSDVSIEYLRETASGPERISVELVYKPDISYADFIDGSLSNLYMYPGDPTYANNFLYTRIRDGRAISIRRYNITLESFRGDQRPYRSDMWVIPVDNWAIRIFHVYPSSMAETADEAFEKFYDNLKWPSKFPDLTLTSDLSGEAPEIDPELTAIIDDDSAEVGERQDKLRTYIARGDLTDDQLGQAYRALAGNYWSMDEKTKALEAAITSAGLLQNKFNGWWYLVRLAQSAEKPKIAAEALIHLMREAPDRLADIEMSWFWRVIRGLRDAGDDEERLALLQVAYETRYQKGELYGGADYIYFNLLELFLESGDVDAASAMASEISTASPWLSIAADRKYEQLWNSEFIDIDAILDDLPERDIRAAMDGAMTHPESVIAMLSLIQALHYSGQLAAAEKLVTTTGGNTKLYNGSQEDWYWFMNEAAYLFEDMNQFERANRVMQSLANIKPEDDGDIVNQIINFGAMLVRQGDPERALEILSIVDGTEYVSEYGQGWIDASAACAYVILADEGAASTAAANLAEHADQNYAAAMEALLCLNRIEEAAELAITRLREEKTRTGMLEAFANYRESADQPPYEKELFDRLRSVRDRPEVLAEINRYGRVIDVPMERAYWGEF